ncbi:hypothetical protein MN113_16255 [Pseudomonas veronii]|uniref:group II intron maturase-specific domain-containing protein n=1 Tax=Pseudomonas veronii TaxID=76761 RepID=UPI0021C074DA|nr:group II intron maturase-specific domain-containing protein [Pseudomonas veronii]MCT8962741.1 hypothetical protein [Pseudomonas veronii]
MVEFLAERGLIHSPEKTKTTHIRDGADFLGWNLRKYNGKLPIKPSKVNIRAHLAKLREVVKTNKTTNQVNLIGLLNPILREWANYHSHVVAKKVFNKIDSEAWPMQSALDGGTASAQGNMVGQGQKFQSPRIARVFSTVEKYAISKARECTLLKESGGQHLCL